MPLRHPHRSDALEVVERLQAVLASVLRLARRRAELADPLVSRRPAARACDGAVAAGRAGSAASEAGRPAVPSRRRDAVGRSFSPALAEIQSVVQGGERRRFEPDASRCPWPRSASSISNAITLVAGQPE